MPASRFAVMGLLDPVVSARWQADGRVYDRRYADQRLAITIADEGGKFDLNTAPKEPIAGLLNEFGADRNQQALITQAILDRRAQFVPATPAPSANTGRIFGQAHVINLARFGPLGVKSTTTMSASLRRALHPSP